MMKSKAESKKGVEPFMSDLQFNFGEWNIGGKLIFFSTIVAILSLFLPWIIGDGDTLGYQQGSSVFLAFFIYPFIALTMDKHINKVVGYMMGVLAVLVPSYLLYYVAGDMGARAADAAGIGIIIFILTGIMLLIGVHKYERYDRYGVDPKPLKRGKPCSKCNKPMEYMQEWDRWYCEMCEEYD